MKFPGQQNLKLQMRGFSFMETLVTLGVLFSGLFLTALSVIYTRNNIQKASMLDFEYSCNELRIKIETRLYEHALLLRSGSALFAVSDSVTSDMWHRFYVRTRIDQFLPGIQGFGYSKVVYPDDLENHVRFFRSRGFTHYEITPKGEREIYTSIIYLEPFTGRNLLAFGYDMYSDPVRRKAMETARDSNIAMLTGKVTLVQETGEDVQAGVLMYIPVFRNGMSAETVEERRKAIAGWVYSPYRMNDLIQGIQGSGGVSHNNPIMLRIYDDDQISEEALLYESQYKGNVLNIKTPNLFLQLPVVFNSKRWTLVFSGRKEEMSIFHKGQVVIWITGIIISILLFVLSIMQINASIRSRQIGELNKQLERLNADKSRFIAILSHDLKSPFTSILGFLELLMTGIRKYSIDQIESYIHIINESARNTYNLLEDLLTWIRAHSGKIPFNPQPVSFRENYENVLDILLPLGESKNINIECLETGNVMLYADKDMLKTIMRNLLSNAIKFTRPGGSIKITAEKQSGKVMISVADTGTGIEEQQLENLFDISKIYSTTGTGGEKGSGLGLVICREFIETHGGKIWAVSELGKGSDFRFTMPDKL